MFIEQRISTAVNTDTPHEQQQQATKLTSLLNELDEIKYINFEQVLALSKEAQIIAHTLNDIEAWATAASYEAWGLSISRSIEQSTEVALKTLEIAQQHKLPAIEGNLLNTLAMNFYNVGDLETFHELLEYQYDLAEKFDLPDLKQTALHDLSVYHNYCGDQKTSTEYLQKCLELDVPTRHRGVVTGVIHTSLAYNYRAQEQYKPAVKHLKQAIELLRPSRASYYLQEVYVYLTEIYLDLDEETLATSYAQQVIDIANESKLPGLIVEAFQNSFTLLRFQRRFDDATAALDEALVWAQKYSLLGEELNIYNDLIQLYTQLEDAEKVAHYKIAQHRLADILKTKSNNQRLAMLVQVYQASQENYQRTQQKLHDESSEYAAVEKGKLPTPNTKPETEQDFAASKRAVMQRIAHEFRTPLAVIRSGTELLARYHDRMSEDQRQQKLENITNRVDWMTMMLDDILLLLQLNRAERKAQPTAVDMAQVINQAIKEIGQPEDSPERIQIEMPEPSLRVRIDPELVKKIIQHLLENALKFSHQPVILNTALRNEQTLTLIVKDSGIGFPESEISKVREIFYRGSNINETPGLGIGLAIVEQSVASCGGEWYISSILNQGSTVTVHLPAKRVTT